MPFMSGTASSLSSGIKEKCPRVSKRSVLGYQREGFIVLVNTTDAFYEAVLTSLRVNSLRAPHFFHAVPRTSSLGLYLLIGLQPLH
jgi:hypothetical protein